MILPEVHRVGTELAMSGYSQTSFEELGIDEFEQRANGIQEAIEGTDQFAELETEELQAGMQMFRDAESLAAGKRLVVPVFQALFAGNPQAIDDFGMYCINRYEEGTRFNPHQDYFDGTVVISTVRGVRQFDVYKKEEEDDVFKEVEASFKLEPGSIMLLNGYKDLGHAAVCLEGPSISVVADVPAEINPSQLS